MNNGILSDTLIAAVRNMLQARFSLKQIAACLGISMREAMLLIGKAGQAKVVVSKHHTVG